MEMTAAPLRHCHTATYWTSREKLDLLLGAKLSFCMSILGQPQRQRCTPPEIQLSMFRQVQSVKTTQN